jgi:exopolysaccharide production protein ExoZ
VTAPTDPNAETGAATETETETGGRRLPVLVNVQYLRGAAALGVVALHAAQISGLGFRWGAFGVHLFFVISGFLMYAITDARSRPGPFLRDRVARVVPLYWIATGATVGLALLHGILPDPGRVVCALLFVPCGVPGEGAHFTPLLNVGWTLNYEMLFYVGFAGSLALPRRAQVPAFILLLLLLLALRQVVGPLSPPFGFWGDPIVFEFAAGLLIGIAFRSPHSKLLLPLLALAALAARIANAVWHMGPAQNPLFVAVTLLCVALALERSGRRPWKIPLALGDASYSIYLWHQFGIAAVATFLRGGGSPPWKFALAASAGVACGLVAYRLIERPILDHFRLRRWRRGAPVPSGV